MNKKNKSLLSKSSKGKSNLIKSFQGENLLSLENITVSFEGFLALNKLNLNLKKGELRAVIGPNGAGKTTFLDVITGKV